MELPGISTAYEVLENGATICTDSRTVTEGCIFFALKGPSFNGNIFAVDAIKKGAALAIVDEDITTDSSRIIKTSDVLTFLQQLALHHRKQLSIPVLAITGSNGKTTTKELINRVLSKKYRTACTKGNLNNHIGVPLTLLQINHQHQIAIVEMGANHQKEIELLCSLALPTHALITNVGKAHLEGFGGFEGVMKGKGEMYDFAKKNDSLVFIHNGNAYLKNMLGNYNSIFTYGVSDDCKVIGTLLDSGDYVALKWKLHNDDSWHVINSQITGQYNFENLLSAIAVGSEFGIESAAICEAIESYVPDNQRSQEIIKGSNKIIMDAYNANPTSMEAALKNFFALKGDSKAVFLGEMLELGDESEAEHQRLVELLGEYQFGQVILVGENFKKAAGVGGILYFSKAEEAGAWIRDQKITNHLILIKGSRGSKMEKVLESF